MCMKRTKANELCAEIGSEGVLCYEILPQLAASVAFVKHLEEHSYKLQVLSSSKTYWRVMLWNLSAMSAETAILHVYANIPHFMPV